MSCNSTGEPGDDFLFRGGGWRGAFFEDDAGHGDFAFAGGVVDPDYGDVGYKGVAVQNAFEFCRSDLEAFVSVGVVSCFEWIMGVMFSGSRWRSGDGDARNTHLINSLTRSVMNMFPLSSS